VSTARKRKRPPTAPSRETNGAPVPLRQRQRLIDATISALHQYGPTGTTVARVVAIAKLSPGIVRFYFRSKAAMLVAALQFLATEFEDRVLTPVAALRDQPARALERLVDLYLDPDIASPRKVAVWYAFWGEASARQEYLAICGQKDANFAALVRELVERMIAASGQRHLDGDAVALGLIGVLEMLWQGFAFEDEAGIDRAAARRRCIAYLRSVFPREFAAAGGVPGSRGPASAPTTDRCVREAWQCIGHDGELAATGDFLTGELAGTRALVVRDADGVLRAFRNSCGSRPHALVNARSGRFDEQIGCALHGLTYGLDGRARQPVGSANLVALELCRNGNLVFVRVPGPGVVAMPALDAGLVAAKAVPAQPEALQVFQVAADWRTVVAWWLDSRLPDVPRAAPAEPISAPVLDIDEIAGTLHWAAARPVLRRQFLWPNTLVEHRADGCSVLLVQPAGERRSRVQWLEYTVGRPAARRAADESRRLLHEQLERELALAVSTEQGAADPDYAPDPAAPTSPAVAAFRRMLVAAGA
jgi:TetR/AcrR family transcriptional repressor of bet genes